MTGAAHTCEAPCFSRGSLPSSGAAHVHVTVSVPCGTTTVLRHPQHEPVLAALTTFAWLQTYMQHGRHSTVLTACGCCGSQRPAAVHSSTYSAAHTCAAACRAVHLDPPSNTIDVARCGCTRQNSHAFDVLQPLLYKAACSSHRSRRLLQDATGARPGGSAGTDAVAPHITQDTRIPSTLQCPCAAGGPHCAFGRSAPVRTHAAGSAAVERLGHVHAGGARDDPGRGGKYVCVARPPHPTAGHSAAVPQTMVW